MVTGREAIQGMSRKGVCRMVADTLTSLLTTERGAFWLLGVGAFLLGGWYVVDATLGLERKNNAAEVRYVTKEILVLETLFDKGSGTVIATFFSAAAFAYCVNDLQYSWFFWTFTVLWAVVSFVGLYILTQKRMEQLPRRRYSLLERDEAERRVAHYNRVKSCLLPDCGRCERNRSSPGRTGA